MTTKPFTILLVEDEAPDAYLVQWALAQNQFNIVWQHVLDGDEALAYLNTAQPLPDLILLDLNMPRMGGLECLSLIQQNSVWRNIPTLILSTSHAPNDRHAAQQLGAADYFSKPMDIQELIQTMHTLGERWITPRLSKHEATV